jgi:protein involved in polysaccharide export with SLBB domain
VLRHGHNGLTQGGSYEETYRSTRLANLTVEDTASFIRQMSMRQPDLVVDLDKLLMRGDQSADLALADGDEIQIPTKPTTVYISGFVNHSGFVPYQEGAPLSYYISRVSGYAEGAVPSKTVVIKAGTKAWLDPDDTKIEPGDEIYVPKEPDVPLDVKRNEITSYATLALSIAGFALTLYNTFHKQ